MKHAIKRHWPEHDQAINDLMRGTADPKQYESVQDWIRQCYNEPNHDEQVMCALNELIGGYGIEAIREDGAWIDNYHGDIAATYINQGDTYAMTIIRDSRTGLFHITDIGTYLENRT